MELAFKKVRECGECTACCTLTYVPELNKLENTTCHHCIDGCTIYPNRPISCRKYECAWLSGVLSDNMRPDKSGAMLEIYSKMVAVLLLPKIGIKELSSTTVLELDKFVEEGKPVIATGLFAKLPTGMSPIEVKEILVSTVREMRGT